MILVMVDTGMVVAMVVVMGVMAAMDIPTKFGLSLRCCSATGEEVYRRY
jgi:hypothetical protein